MYKLSKRTFDITIGIILLLIFAPLFFLISLVLILSGEKIFYTQYRIGFHQKKFKIWKFTTMIKNSSEIGNKTITLRNDKRVTKFGKILRYSKLNELPQLFNLLNGTMTLVGPRPHMDLDFNLYPNEIKNKIFNIKPGITGIGSIIFRDQELMFTKEFEAKGIYPY